MSDAQTSPVSENTTGQPEPAVEATKTSTGHVIRAHKRRMPNRKVAEVSAHHRGQRKQLSHDD